MKKIILLILTTLLLIGCIKGPEYNESEVVKENIENIFGNTFDPKHDWSSIVSGEITVTPLSGSIEIQILAYTEDGTLKILTKSEGNSETKLKYDAPNTMIALFVACISEGGGYYIKEIKPTDKIVSFLMPLSTRAITRSSMDGSERLTIIGSEISYETQRGYPGFESEILYQFNSVPYTVSNYDLSTLVILRSIIFTYLPNGRKYNNLSQIKESGYYNENCYAITTGKEPIIVSPIYKNDGGYHEVETCELYYYYFKDPETDIKSLPKYRLIKLNECIKGDDVLEKHCSYKLVYWKKDGTGTYDFPPGYKIGFMLRSNYKNDVKKGELYFDGRLNTEINKHGHFASSKLGPIDPRMCWLSINHMMLMCCEGGTDSDFNDVILEVSGGVEPIEIPITPEYNSYTFLFEDQLLGDYDMNDVVLKAERLSDTKIKYSLLACGAYDELYLRNLGGKVLNEGTEVHRILGSEGFINTVSKSIEPVTEIITVPKTFSFNNLDEQVYIYNKTTNREIRMSQKGQDPHGIMIPTDFKWPKEKICIKDAYLGFGSWGHNKIDSIGWYLSPVENNVIK